MARVSEVPIYFLQGYEADTSNNSFSSEYKRVGYLQTFCPLPDECVEMLGGDEAQALVLFTYMVPIAIRVNAGYVLLPRDKHHPEYTALFHNYSHTSRAHQNAAMRVFKANNVRLEALSSS